MTDPDEKPEVSASGDRILRHKGEEAWAPPAETTALEEISAHIALHLGEVKTVFHEIVSDAVHIDVHIVEPNGENPFVRLVTSGMSDLPMHLPEGVEAPRFLELMVTLPTKWMLDKESLKDDNWYWPMRLIKELARFPHKYRTWLGFGHTLPHGDPPKGLCAKYTLVLRVSSALCNGAAGI
jgi:hypothetical protein